MRLSNVVEALAVTVACLRSASGIRRASRSIGMVTVRTRCSPLRLHILSVDIKLENRKSKNKIKKSIQSEDDYGKVDLLNRVPWLRV
jgi:hypothetical protein